MIVCVFRTLLSRLPNLLLLVQSVLRHQPVAGIFFMGDRPSTMPTPQDALPGMTFIMSPQKITLPFSVIFVFVVYRGLTLTLLESSD